MDTKRLLQITDTHLFADPQGRLRGTRTLPALTACLAHAAHHYLPADAVAATGDLVQDDADGYLPLGIALETLNAPVLLIPGNHDRPAELRARMDRWPFRVGGTFDLGRWTVVMLETWYSEALDGEGQIGRAQLDWLRKVLQAHRGQHVLVCMHHPPIAMESAGLDALGLLDAEEFMGIVDSRVNVRGIAWGHAHQSLDVYRGELRLMCTPATCMQFKPRNPGFVTDQRPPGYRVIELHADGGIASEVVWLEGYKA